MQHSMEESMMNRKLLFLGVIVTLVASGVALVLFLKHNRGIWGKNGRKKKVRFVTMTPLYRVEKFAKSLVN